MAVNGNVRHNPGPPTLSLDRVKSVPQARGPPKSSKARDDVSTLLEDIYEPLYNFPGQQLEIRSVVVDRS